MSKRRNLLILALLSLMLLSCVFGTLRANRPAGMCSFDCGDLGYRVYELRDGGECWCLERGEWSRIW